MSHVARALKAFPEIAGVGLGLEKTKKSQELGFKAAKLEICIKGPYSHNNLQIEDDNEFAKMVKLCRKAVGNEMVLMADVAYAWSDWKSALNALDMIKDQNLYFIETPLPIEDLEGCSKLAQSTNTRIATGEMLQTRFECFETIDRGNVDIIQPDVGRVGGLTEAKRVCDYAEDKGVLVVPHCWKSAIGIAASTHLSATTLSCPYIEFLPKELAESQLRKDLVMESTYDPRRMGTLMTARMMVGHNILRPECAVSINKS